MSKVKTSNNSNKAETKSKDKPNVSWIKLYTYATALDWLGLLFGAICAIGSGAALPLLSLILGNVINILGTFTAGTATPDQLMEQIGKSALYFVYLAIGVFATTYIFMAIYKSIGERLTYIIRHRYLVGVLKQEMAWSDAYGAGQVATCITSNTDLVQDGISEKVALIIHDLATFISGFVIAFVKNWKLTLVTMCIVPIIVIVIFFLNKYMVKYSTSSLDEYANAGTLAEESISSIRTLIAFNQKNKILKRYQEIIKKAEASGLKKSISLGIALGCIFCTIYLGYALAFWFGGKLILWGESDGGSIVSVFSAILVGTFSLSNVAPNFQSILLARGAAFKLFEAIDRVPVIDSSSDAGLKPSIVT
ncbi:hypothetical protein CONCODRAFT_167782, partial [Conidiobolus coronatus NRRL 28638]